MVNCSLFSQETYEVTLSRKDGRALTAAHFVAQGSGGETGFISFFIPGNQVGSFLEELGLLKLNEQGVLAERHLIGSSSGPLRIPSDFAIDGKWHALMAQGRAPSSLVNPLLVFNFEDSIFWGKATGPRSFERGRCAFAGEGNSIVISYSALVGDYVQSVGLAKFQLHDGIQEWSHKYTNGSVEGFSIIFLGGTEDDGSLLAGNFASNSEGGNFLLKVDNQGQPVSSVQFQLSHDSLQIASASQDGAGNIYLAGRVLKDTARNQYNRPTYHGFVAKLNQDMEVRWSKELLAEEFPCKDIAVQAFPDGEVLLTYVSYGDLPIIAGRLETIGELLWRQGYEFYDPDISLSEDGSISFLTSRRYAPDGTWSSGVTLAKTLPDGSLPGCPQFTACLELEDMPLPLAPMVWEASPGPILPDVDVEVAPSDFVAEPYCGTPAPPTPYFELPDTLCQGACAALDSLPNALASQAAWKVEGPGGLDTAFTGKTFSWCFDRPGLYLVRQTVWLLGCAEEYEQTVEVLPALELSLGGSRVLCGAPPYALSPASSRPLRSYDWGGGQHSGSLPVDSSGHYRLLASDGHCTAADSLRLVFLSDTLAGPVFEYGPRDTVLCRAFLPYSLEVGGAYPLAYTLDGRPMEGGRAELARAGTYVLGAELHGCPLTDTLRLEADECPAAIYLPTAFSPNGDGINDQWRPLGKDFEALRLRVYGRWGSLLHEAEGAGAVWDGRSQGKPAPNGTYTLVLDYRNTRTGEEGQVVQAVDLVR